MVTNKQSKAKRLRDESRVLQHYWKLQATLKPLGFEPLCIALARLLQEDRSRSPAQCRLPPHIALSIIEAAAVYSVGSTEHWPSDEALDDLLQLYRSYRDPQDRRLLVDFQSLALWMVRVDRQQLQLQSSANYFTIGRVIRLFRQGDLLKSTDEALISAHGFSIDDWLSACFVVWAATQNKPVGVMTNEYVSQIPNSFIEPRRLQECLKILACTPTSLKEHFNERHPPERPLEWDTTTSVFTQKPLIRFSRGWIAPMPSLLIGAATCSLYSLAREVANSSLGPELGTSLEHYSTELFSALPQNPSETKAKAIARHTTELACDQLWEFKRSILLVECKGIQSTRRTLSTDSFINSGETRQLTKGLKQLRDTARDIRNGLFDKIVSDSKKPIFAIILTYGTFPAANHGWYRTNVLHPRYSMDNRGEEFNPAPLEWTPQIMDMKALDYFVSWLAIHDDDPSVLMAHGREAMASTMSEWGRFLNAEIAGQPNPIREFWKKPFESLWRERFEPALLAAGSASGESTEEWGLPESI